MKVPLRLWAVLMAVWLSGCATTATTATLTPTAGPLVLSGAGPIQVEIKGIMGDKGALSFTLQGGERVTGELVAVHPDLSGTDRAATGHGNRGSIFDIKFDCDGFGRGSGEATDNHGNTYRVLVHGI